MMKRYDEKPNIADSMKSITGNNISVIRSYAMEIYAHILIFMFTFNSEKEKKKEIQKPKKISYEIM